MAFKFILLFLTLKTIIDIDTKNMIQKGKSRCQTKYLQSKAFMGYTTQTCCHW